MFTGLTYFGIPLEKLCRFGEFCTIIWVILAGLYLVILLLSYHNME